MTDEQAIWVSMLLHLLFAAYAATLALELLYPRLTLRQRWAVVFWLAVAANGFRSAWEIGGRS